jgi:hypothetical protein
MQEEHNMVSTLPAAGRVVVQHQQITVVQPQMSFEGSLDLSISGKE